MKESKKAQMEIRGTKFSALGTDEGFALLKPSHKKAQMEIMGIAIVVVLMLVGLALVVAFIILKPQSDVRAEYTQSQLASNTIGAILKTTVPICKEQMDDLIIDCSGQKWIVCRNATNNYTSCEIVENTLDIIFEQTLNTFETNFYFEVGKINASGASIPVTSASSAGIRKDCTNSTGTRMSREQATYTLPTPSGKNLNILLQICT